MGAVTSSNWRRLAVTTLMLALKAWDDEPFENTEFAELLPCYSCEEIDTLEHALVEGLGYDVSVSEAEYARARSLLQDLGTQSSISMRLPPLLEPQRAISLGAQCLKLQAELQ